jgi:CHAT domain-containing protein
MLERASMMARQGGATDEVRKQYGEAVEAMIASQAAGSIDATGIERYLDLLVQEARAAPREDTYELFFKALQSVGEPAVARQLNQLQAVVSSDPELGGKFRERDDLERRLTGLRYQISSAPEAERAGLEQQRAALQVRLDQLGVELAANARASSIDDRPATLAELRAALRPGEAYFKITPLNRRAYGLVIDRERTQIYPIDAPLDVMIRLAAEIRSSIDGGLETEQRDIPRFKVRESYALFRLLTGPAADTLLAAKSIIVEPSGPLERLPLGVLITDRASVQRYQPRSRSRDLNEAYNYSDLAFLASRAELATAVSPRSFLVARSRTPSQASQPFIGFAEHSPESVNSLPTSGNVKVGEACFADAARLRELVLANVPIQRAEVTVAKNALGVPQAPVMAGADFTDTAVQQRADLDQYQVLHFATHGLEEGRFGCAKSPPALLTSFGDRNSDGLLSFDEIAGLRLNANLVVLSACETAGGASQELARRSGQEEGGSTLEGLVRAFLTANSRAVLATYWQVSAASETDELVRTFYTSARGTNIGSSLRTAQQSLMQNPEFSHPFYWGAYFVVGDSSKMMLSGSGQSAQAASR